MSDNLKGLSLAELAERIKGHPVLEFAELVKELLTRLDPVSGQAAPAAPSAPAQNEEMRLYEVILVSIGDKKVEVIKAVREITTLGLKEAKDLVEAAPKPVKDRLFRHEADAAAGKLTDAGATVDIRSSPMTSGYVGNKISLKFHRPSCTSPPTEPNRIYLPNRSAAVSAGYEPCGYCKP